MGTTDRRRRLRIALAVAGLCLPGVPAFSGDPGMVADLNPGGRRDLGIDPTGPSIVSGDLLYFVADHPLVGRELWVSDGTAAGTHLVLDIEPGWSGSSPTDLVDLDGTILFTAQTRYHGDELWAHDDSGTRRVTDLVYAGSDPFPRLTTVIGDRALFSSGYSSLWVTDGTADGTAEIMPDLRIGPIAALDGVGYFAAASSGSDDRELWRSDGTPAGTWRVADIWPGSHPSAPEELVEMGGVLYFSAETSAAGRELWRSDGTEAGTWRVEDIQRGSGGSDPEELTPACGTLFFAADDGLTGRELWRSDGTHADTRLVRDLEPGPDGGLGYNSLAAFRCGVVLVAGEPATGGEPWFSDGTTLGTALLRDINPGPASSLTYSFFAMEDRVYFGASDGVTGKELWTSDGTPAGTVQVADIQGGPGASYPGVMGAIGGTVYLTAFSEATGRELWRSDGTAAGTVPVYDEAVANSSSPECLGGDGFAYCSAAGEGIGRELWYSDGTAAGTRLVLDANPGPADSWPKPIALLDRRLLFSANDGIAHRLWVTDGTPAGTTFLASLIGHRGTVLDGVAYFWAQDDDGTGLWRSDGTVQGTSEIHRFLWDGSYRGRPIVALGSLLLFAAQDDLRDQELWRSDGSPQGTRRLADINPGPESSDPSWLTVLGDRVIFSAGRSGHGRNLWVTDGTEQGTELIVVGSAAPPPTRPWWLTALGDHVVFTAEDASRHRTLWRTDGTSEGTVRISDDEFTDATYLRRCGDVVLFRAYDVEHGRELWRTDGTAGGTYLALDLIPGPGSGAPWSYDMDAVAHDRLWFSGPWEGLGRELIATDGTWAGTRVFDVAPGPASSMPLNPAPAGTLLFFAAEQLATGRELYAVTLTLFQDGFEAGDTSAWSDTGP